ncbi:hypothetical protein BDW67DRAFT_152118, partial [Aspergillus spinulosporus]
MKFAQAWVIEFEQRSKGSAAGFVGPDYIATRRTKSYPVLFITTSQHGPRIYKAYV